MVNFSNLFRPTQQVQVAAPQPQAPQPQQQQQPQGPGSSMQPHNVQQMDPQNISNIPSGASQNGNKPPAAENPLDAFKDIWQNPQNNGDDPFATPLMSLDANKLREGAGKLDFLQGVDPQLAQQALGGDPQALGNLINSAVRNAFVMSTQLGTQATEQAITKNNSRYDTRVDGRIREYNLRNSKSSNPVLQHPAAQPLLENLKQQFARSQPNLSAEEVTQAAEQYLTTFASQLMGTQQQSQPQQGSEEQDFSRFFM